MDSNELIQNMERAVIHGEVEETKQWAVRAIENNLDILTILNECLIKGIRKVGDQFGNGEIFLPDLL
jgi:methanogenic corrinoid protein MtbC1